MPMINTAQQLTNWSNKQQKQMKRIKADSTLKYKRKVSRSINDRGVDSIAKVRKWRQKENNWEYGKGYDEICLIDPLTWVLGERVDGNDCETREDISIKTEEMWGNGKMGKNCHWQEEKKRFIWETSREDQKSWWNWQNQPVDHDQIDRGDRVMIMD